MHLIWFLILDQEEYMQLVRTISCKNTFHDNQNCLNVDAFLDFYIVSDPLE